MRQLTISKRGITARTKASNKVGAFSGNCCADTGPLTRPRYFTGQLLTAADFQAEQDYFREKMRRLTRCLFGCGIISGLGVTVNSPAEGGTVVIVNPGCAIDGNGELITLCEPLQCNLHVRSTMVYVVVRYLEQPVDAVPTPGDSTEYSRIKELVSVAIEQNVPAEGVALARLKYSGRKWRIDPQFRPPRLSE